MRASGRRDPWYDTYHVYDANLPRGRLISDTTFFGVRWLDIALELKAQSPESRMRRDSAPAHSKEARDTRHAIELP